MHRQISSIFYIGLDERNKIKSNGIFYHATAQSQNKVEIFRLSPQSTRSIKSNFSYRAILSTKYIGLKLNYLEHKTQTYVMSTEFLTCTKYLGPSKSRSNN
jgi:hypothetical protein